MNKRRTLLYIYSTLVFIFGLCIVPLKSIYNDKIYRLVYAPIWKLKTNMIVDVNTLYYEVDIQRVLITLLVLTLITTSLYILLNDIKK